MVCTLVRTGTSCGVCPHCHSGVAAVQELAHHEVVRLLKLDQAKEMSKVRQEFELQARELQQKYEKKMKLLREDLELRRKAEVGGGGDGLAGLWEWGWGYAGLCIKHLVRLTLPRQDFASELCSVQCAVCSVQCAVCCVLCAV
jgi:hypothetical protein